MNIFITGAAGYIGGSVANALLEEGHVIRGLVRDPEKVELLAARGVTPVFGNLDDLGLLVCEAQQADAVINTASSDHRASVEALLQGLHGSGKPFLHTSGSSVIGDDVRGDKLSEHVFDEDTHFIVELGKAGTSRHRQSHPRRSDQRRAFDRPVQQHDLRLRHWPSCGQRASPAARAAGEP
jgi:nucleoside-diphosphate-sugar epimerase